MVGLLRSRLISVGNAVIAEVQKQVHVRRKPTGYHKRLDQRAIIMKSIELADLRAVQYQGRIIDSQDKQECSRPVLKVKKECGQCEIEPQLARMGVQSSGGLCTDQRATLFVHPDVCGQGNREDCDITDRSSDGQFARERNESLDQMKGKHS